MAGQQVPLLISVAPFPEGFQGDMDETWQQGALLMSAFVEGNFLTGLILPPGSTLPSTDQGPIFMGGVWYYWDSATGQYLPQTISSKIAQNYARNCCYQIQQTGSTIPISNAGITPVYDMAICRASVPNVLGVSLDVGPPAGADNEFIPAAIKYTVGPALVATPASADLCAHEHIFEGSDIIMLQGQGLSLSFSVRGSTPGVYSVYLTNSGRDHSYVTQFTLVTPNLWTRIKISGIPPMPTASGTWNFGEGVTGLYIGVVMLTGTQWQTTSLNSWQPVFAAGASNNINMLTVVNNQLDITGIKLEASADVTFLSVPPFQDDFEEMLRYYFTTYNYQSNSAGFPILLTAPQNGQYAAQFGFPRRMARVPTVVPYGWGSNTSGQITDMSVATPFDIPVATLAATKKGVSDLQTLTITTTGTTSTFTDYADVDGSSVWMRNIPSTGGMAVGLSVSGPGILLGATITAIATSTAITISLPTGGAGTQLVFTFGTFTISAIPSTAGMAVGMFVSGAGIPAGAKITQINSSTSITISKSPTAAATGITLTISKIPQGDVLRALITADARLS
jgi:hypothetical protein